MSTTVKARTKKQPGLVTTRLTPDLERMLCEAAWEAHKSPSRFLRELVAEHFGVDPDEEGVVVELSKASGRGTAKGKGRRSRSGTSAMSDLEARPQKPRSMKTPKPTTRFELVTSSLPRKVSADVVPFPTAADAPHEQTPSHLPATGSD